MIKRVFGPLAIYLAFSQSLFAGLATLVIPPEAPAKKVECKSNFKDVKEDIDVKSCYRNNFKETRICESADIDSAYNQLLQKSIQANPPVNLSTLSVSTPLEFAADGNPTKINRTIFYKDATSGQILYIERFDYDKDMKISNRKVYADPAKIPYAEKLVQELGQGFEGGDMAAIEFEGVYREAIAGDFSKGVPLNGCDFIASAGKNEGFLSGLDFALGDNATGDSAGDGADQGIPLDPSRVDVGANSYDDDGNYGYSPNKCFMQIQRGLYEKEAGCYSQRLGLNNDVTQIVGKLQEVSQVTFLEYMTTAVLSNFMRGYVAQSGSPVDTGELVKLNPDCRHYSQFLDNTQGQQLEAYTQLVDQNQKRHEPGSDYLKGLMAEAKVHHKDNTLLPPGNKNPLESYTLKELVETKKHLDELCNRGPRDEQGDFYQCDKGAWENFSVAGMSCVPGWSMTSFQESIGCGRENAQIEKLIAQKDAIYPVLANDYDPQIEDTWWASEYSYAQGRGLLDTLNSKEMGKLDLDSAAGVATLNKVLDPYKEKLNQRNLKFLASACSARRWSCEDSPGMCWRNLLGLPGLAQHVSMALSPAFDGAYQCLKDEMQAYNTFNQTVSIAMPLACAGLGIGGLGAAFFTGGASVAGALALGSTVCGLAVYNTLDSSTQREAMLAFESGRICTELSELCTVEDVRKNEAALIGAIFNKKVSLVGEAFGLVMEGVGAVKGASELLQAFSKVPVSEKGRLVDFLSFMVAGKKLQTPEELAQALADSQRMVQSLLDGTSTLDEIQLGVLADLSKSPTPFDVLKFKSLPDVQQMQMLRAQFPGMADESLRALQKQLLEMKNPKLVLEVASAASKNGNSGAQQMMGLLKTPDLPDEEFAEMVGMLYVMNKQGKLGKQAGESFEDFLANTPELQARLEKAMQSMGCG